jgi:AraC-like DNA-binding protein
MSTSSKLPHGRAPDKGASQLAPKFEQIVTAEDNTFLWRIDDYPWAHSFWNFHPEFEIHLIRKSSGTAYVGDYIGDFGPGDLTVIGSNLPHDWVSHIDKDDKILGRDLVVQFNPEKLRQASQHLPEMKRINAFLIAAQRGLRFSGDTAGEAAHLLEDIAGTDGLERLTRFLQVLELLAGSDEYEVLSSPEFMPNVDAVALNTMQRAILYIHGHFTEKIQLPDVATIAGMSTNRFSRFFIKNTGRSFTDYVVSLRIGRACRLLSASHEPITEICYEVGYTNLSNFNRSFLRHVGKSPSAYRKAAHAKRVSADSHTGQ